ncbi:MAG: sulfatase [Planctomycetes bacterium]|nr:sulfatase [Planctomycetota bacterium]
MTFPFDPMDGTRRHFLARSAFGLGAAALARLDPDDVQLPHFPPRVRRVIYLFQSGGPAQHDLFDYKPLLNEKNGEELPASVRRGQRLTGMSGNQATLPLAGSIFPFHQRGECGAWVSDLLPHTARIVDKLCFIRSMHTEAINHDPGITFFQTGSQIAGRPSIGSWLSYGLGSLNKDLPDFVVLVTKNKGGQPLYARLWGAGFLPARHQGVQFRAGKDPVLFLTDPGGIERPTRRRMLDALRTLHLDQRAHERDPAIDSRMAQAELAYRMQTSVPEVADLSGEGDEGFDLYGKDARTPGTYAANCLLARRLLERGVRFVQLFHQGWDQHGNLPKAIRTQCRETDQASAALVLDLERRGLLDDTLVIWGGEFGRTNYSQGKLTKTNYGRDHHPRCFTFWLAGAGIRGGYTHGTTDPYGYNIESDPVHVHDLHATLLHLLGIDHERLTYRFQGRRYRLTDVRGHVVRPILGS